MNVSAEQLRERVRLLQEELELKRHLLKKAEKKSKLRQSNVCNGKNEKRVEFEQTLLTEPICDTNFLSGATVSTNVNTEPYPPELNILGEIRSCVQTSNVLALHHASPSFRLLCLLTSDHHLKLYQSPTEEQQFCLVWEKALNPSHVEAIHLMTCVHNEPPNTAINLFLLERFEFPQVSTLIFSLFTFRLADHQLSNLSFTDTLFIPFSIVQPQAFTGTVTSTLCKLHKEENCYTWVVVYTPWCMQYFILTLSCGTEAVPIFRLRSHASASHLSSVLDPSWFTAVQSVNENAPLQSFFAVHSRPDPVQFIGHCCKLLAGAELVCTPFSIQTPDEVLKMDRHVIASNIMPLIVDSVRTLISVVFSNYRTHTPTPSHLLIALVHCSDETTCVPLRLCDINLPIEAPVATFTLLDQLPDCHSRQYVLHIALTLLAGRPYMNVFAWSVGQLLSDSANTTPLQLSTQIPIDVPVFVPIKRSKLLHHFSKLTQVAFLYDVHLRTAHILGQFG